MSENKQEPRPHNKDREPGHYFQDCSEVDYVTPSSDDSFQDADYVCSDDDTDSENLSDTQAHPEPSSPHMVRIYKSSDKSAGSRARA